MGKGPFPARHPILSSRLGQGGLGVRFVGTRRALTSNMNLTGLNNQFMAGGKWQ